jgi:uncharacterized damage-inducible protein DinB
MSDEFSSDLHAALAELADTRAELRQLLADLTDDDLGRARRGEWSVGSVLGHLIGADQGYQRLIAFLREMPDIPESTLNEPQTVSGAIGDLDAARNALLSAVDGVDEETFYRLRMVPGLQEYSVLSVIRDASGHEREHVEQIRGTL